MLRIVTKPSNLFTFRLGFNIIFVWEILGARC
nr:MAG TPA: hypothetical protein [Bacteriophage sp.]